jgi:hypothetical protein
MGRGQQLYHVDYISFLLLILDSHLDRQLDTGIPYPIDIALPVYLQVQHGPLPVPGLPLPA